MAKGRGLYGQQEGWETNSTATIEKIADFQVAVGNEVATLNRMLKNRNWQQAAQFIEKLRNQGYATSVIQGIQTSAMHGVRF